MNYLIIALAVIAAFSIAHFLVVRFYADEVFSYLNRTQTLLDENMYTDGCTLPFGLNGAIHSLLPLSFKLCAAHDYGGLNQIIGVRPGWHNNWIVWLAHLSQANPAYWLWGTIVALFTLPWVVWRRNLGITIIENATGFYVIQMILVLIYILIINKPVS